MLLRALGACGCMETVLLSRPSTSMSTIRALLVVIAAQLCCSSVSDFERRGEWPEGQLFLALQSLVCFAEEYCFSRFSLPREVRDQTASICHLKYIKGQDTDGKLASPRHPFFSLRSCVGCAHIKARCRPITGNFHSSSSASRTKGTASQCPDLPALSRSNAALWGVGVRIFAHGLLFGDAAHLRSLPHWSSSRIGAAVYVKNSSSGRRGTLSRLQLPGLERGLSMILEKPGEASKSSSDSTKKLKRSSFKDNGERTKDTISCVRDSSRNRIQRFPYFNVGSPNRILPRSRKLYAAVLPRRTIPHLVEFYGNAADHPEEMNQITRFVEDSLNTRFLRLQVYGSPQSFALLQHFDAKNRCGGLPFYVNLLTLKTICGSTTIENMLSWAQGLPSLTHCPPAPREIDFQAAKRKTGFSARIWRSLDQVREAGQRRMAKRLEDEIRRSHEEKAEAERQEEGDDLPTASHNSASRL